MKGSFTVFLVLAGLMIGFLTGIAIARTNYESVRAIPSIQYTFPEESASPNYPEIEKFFEMPKTRDSPSDRVQQQQIKAFRNSVTIDIHNPIIAKFADTKSMEPVINKDSNAIEIIPESEDDIHVGDIISYNSAFSKGTIIHRVVEINTDEKGRYFTTKGDNLDYHDPEKIRFGQIKRVVVGIIY